MVQARRGWIVLISSVVGLLGAAGQTDYAASRAGLVGFARSVARELGSRGVTCNVVVPRVRRDGHDQSAERQAARSHAGPGPLGCSAQAEEVAAVRFLVSEDAACATGAALPVDGDLGMGH
jgi:3-oxoacyl-[acyl-carrier protein] reductase